MRPAPAITVTDSLAVRPWPDPVIDALGHDPCSPYVERFWLGVLGPSTTFLLRHLATALAAQPDGFDLALSATARRLGLGDKGGRNSPFMRSLARLVQFELAQMIDPTTLAVRRRVPPLARRHLARLPEPVRAEHERWLETHQRPPTVAQLRTRSRQLALTYVDAGLDAPQVEAQLLRLGYHPAMCFEASRWALERTRATSAASTDLGGDAA